MVWKPWKPARSWLILTALYSCKSSLFQRFSEIFHHYFNLFHRFQHVVSPKWLSRFWALGGDYFQRIYMLCKFKTCFRISKEYHIISTYIAVYQFILFISTCLNKINSFNKISTYINIFHVCPLKLSALMCLYIFQHFSFTVFWHSLNMVFCLSTLFQHYFNINFNIISTSCAKLISTLFQHVFQLYFNIFHQYVFQHFIFQRI